MSFLTGILNAIKAKQKEVQDRKDFLALVEERAKPIRRKAYLHQMLQSAENEGKIKAKLDSEARVQTNKKTEKDFGFSDGLNNPFKYLDNNNLDNSKTKSKENKK